jgi:hypothetical protein
MQRNVQSQSVTNRWPLENFIPKCREHGTTVTNYVLQITSSNSRNKKETRMNDMKVTTVNTELNRAYCILRYSVKSYQTQSGGTWGPFIK